MSCHILHFTPSDRTLCLSRYTITCRDYPGTVLYHIGTVGTFLMPVQCLGHLRNFFLVLQSDSLTDFFHPFCFLWSLLISFVSLWLDRNYMLRCLLLSVPCSTMSDSSVVVREILNLSNVTSAFEMSAQLFVRRSIYPSQCFQTYIAHVYCGSFLGLVRGSVSCHGCGHQYPLDVLGARARSCKTLNKRKPETNPNPQTNETSKLNNPNTSTKK